MYVLLPTSATNDVNPTTSLTINPPLNTLSFAPPILTLSFTENECGCTVTTVANPTVEL